MQLKDMKLPSNWRGRLVERWVVSVWEKGRTLYIAPCFYLSTRVEGGKTDSDDSSVRSHMGRRTSSDCCEL